MKRKLIDIKESTFAALSSHAHASGVNLKQYIESMLDDRAAILEGSDACKYRFSSSGEPSDRNLSAIMKCAAESASRKKHQAMSEFYSSIRQTVNNLR